MRRVIPKHLEFVHPTVTPQPAHISEAKAKDDIRILSNFVQAFLGLFAQAIRVHGVVHFVASAGCERVDFLPLQLCPFGQLGVNDLFPCRVAPVPRITP